MRDYVLAAIVAVAGGAALVFYPHDTLPPAPPGPEAPEPEQPAPEAPAPEEPAPEEPAPEAPAPEEPAPEEPAPEEPEAPEPEAPGPGPLDPDGDVFTYGAPGALPTFDYRNNVDMAGRSGSGWAGSGDLSSQYVFAPELAWPIDGAGYANTQVYRPGGNGAGVGGPGGSGECDARNFDYPFEDNFCEIRSSSTRSLFCPDDSTGHHVGQDIRPEVCTRNFDLEDRQMAVAVADGYILEIASMTVKLRGNDGRIYWYLHLEHWEDCDLSQLDEARCTASNLPSVCTRSALEVEPGDDVRAGDPIGRVSNWFGIGWRGGSCQRSMTTDHLHFEIRDTIDPDGSLTASSIPVPPYSSLVMSYLRHIGADEDDMPDWEEAQF
ncbi:MAG: hypothetical protein GC187_13535 [Alphaproteobacteria bacterium]|nr:hypothetical protein [Alphaproteobacteria bacterium]